MYPGSLPYALSLLAIAVLTGGIGLYAFQHSRRSGAKTFGWLMVAITEWVASYAIETFSPTLASKVFAEKLTYLGIAATPMFWFIFALEYTGNAKWLTRRVRFLLTAWPLAVFLLALTNDWHRLMWDSAKLDPDGLPGLIFDGYGPAFWMMVIIAYALVLAGIALYVVTYLRTTRLFRKQIGIMVAGSLIPLIANAIFLTDQFQAHGLDRTPYMFAVSGLMLAFGFFRYDLLNLIPLAAPLVIENLRDPVIVLDEQMRVVNLNPAARKWLNAGEESIGADAHQVLKGMEVIWEHWDAPEAQFQLELGEAYQRRWFHLMISALRNKRGQLQGRVIVARDRTQEQASLLAERRYTREIELINSITRAALESMDFREMIQLLADQLGSLLEADGAFITLWDNAKQAAVPAAAYGGLRETYPLIQIDPGEHSLTKSVLELGHPLVIEDVFDTPYMSQNIAARFPTKSVLALPLIANRQKLGAALIGFNQPHYFTSEEISVGGQIAPQIALAIYKAQLFDQSNRRVTQLALLDEVSKEVANSLDERDILERTVDAVVKNFGYAEAAISLLVDGDQLELSAHRGTENIGYQTGFRQKVGEGIIGHTAEIHETYATGDVEHDPYYFTIGKRSGSAVGLPMLGKDQLLGVLYVESTTRNAFDHDDIQTLHTLVSHVVTAIQKARLFAQTQNHLRTMTTLQSISQALSSSLELENIVQTVIQLLKDSFGYTYLSIYLLDDDTLRLGAQVGYPPETVISEISLASGVAGRAARTRQTQFIRDVSKDPVFLRASHEIESEICIPLLKENNLLGVLNVEAAPGHPLTEKDVDILTALAGPITVAMDNAHLHAEVKSLAMTDGLTGVLNRRTFDQYLDTEVARASRYGHAVALIMVDIDNFKIYNDQWGHPAGDERLKAIAHLFLSNVRHPDIVARYGGEEFTIILPYTPLAGGVAIAERVRKGAEALAPADAIRENGSIPGYTISLGVAAFPESAQTASELLLAADNAELNAKKLGRNRVSIAEAIHEIPKR